MAEQNIKVVEKHYIEISPSGWHKFLHGILSGLGWGLGVTLGTAAFIILIGYFASRIDWVPIVGNFLENVVQSAQQAPAKNVR